MEDVSKENVNDSFFDGIYKDVWRVMMPAGLTEAEVGFIQQEGGLSKGDRVLDLMCGYGRHAIPLSKAGYSVIGIDNQKTYIQEINHLAENEGLSLISTHGHVVNSAYPDDISCVICMGNSLNFFPEQDVSQILKKIHKSLKPGGVLIIGSWSVAEIVYSCFKENDEFKVDSFTYKIKSKFKTNPSRIESVQTIIDSNNNEDHIPAIDFVYSIDHLACLGKSQGLQIKNLYSTPKMRPFLLGANAAYISLMKPF